MSASSCTWQSGPFQFRPQPLHTSTLLAPSPCASARILQTSCAVSSPCFCICCSHYPRRPLLSWPLPAWKTSQLRSWLSRSSLLPGYLFTLHLGSLFFTGIIYIPPSPLHCLQKNHFSSLYILYSANLWPMSTKCLEESVSKWVNFMMFFFFNWSFFCHFVFQYVFQIN